MSAAGGERAAPSPIVVAALDNQLGGGDAPAIDEVRRRALLFVQDEAGFAQVFTVNAAGCPVGRTMVAPLLDDWSVPLVQRRVHRRLAHLAARPQVEIVWVGTPAPGASNDHPHVFDADLLPPRVVFLRGRAEEMDAATTWWHYERLSAIQLGKGHHKAPRRDRANVDVELAGLLVRPTQVRAEGFGDGPQSFTWREASW